MMNNPFEAFGFSFGQQTPTDPNTTVDPIRQALLSRLTTPPTAQNPMDFFKALMDMGLIGGSRGNRVRMSDGRMRATNVQGASYSGTKESGNTNPTGMTPEDDWRKMFKTAPERANREAEQWGVPVENTITGMQIADNSMSTNDRMNNNLGITNDMTPEQRKQIIARATAARTGMPLDTYLPPEGPNVYNYDNGRRELYGKYGYGDQDVSRQGPDIKGTINGQPSSNYGKPPAARPFDQAAWEKANPQMAAALRKQVRSQYGL